MGILVNLCGRRGWVDAGNIRVMLPTAMVGVVIWVTVSVSLSVSVSVSLSLSLSLSLSGSLSGSLSLLLEPEVVTAPAAMVVLAVAKY